MQRKSVIVFRSSAINPSILDELVHDAKERFETRGKNRAKIVVFEAPTEQKDARALFVKIEASGAIMAQVASVPIMRYMALLDLMTENTEKGNIKSFNFLSESSVTITNSDGTQREITYDQVCPG